MPNNDFHNFELFIRRASFLSIRFAVNLYLIEMEKYAEENKGKLNQEEIETIWQLRDFLEIYDILKRPHED